MRRACTVLAVSRIALLLALSCLTTTRALGQTRPEDEDIARLPERPAASRLGLEIRMSGVLDSNIDHDEADLDSYGGTMAARAQLRTRRLNLRYQAGVDRFSQTVLWNRASHRVGAELRHRLSSRWRANALAELALGHSSEDRELVGNQYTLAPELEHRFDDVTRAYLYGRYRVRRFGEHEVRDDETWQTGTEFRHEGNGRHAWSGGYRYEVVDAALARSSYRRHWYVVDYGYRATPRDEFLWGLTFRPRRYPDRVVELASGDTLRRDQRWTHRIGWARTLSDDVRVEASYAFDRQSSNDQRKNFQAHRLALTMGWVVR